MKMVFHLLIFSLSLPMKWGVQVLFTYLVLNVIYHLYSSVSPCLTTWGGKLIVESPPLIIRLLSCKS